MATSIRPDRAEAEPLLPTPAGAPDDLTGLPADSILRSFHPAVAGWFLRRFPAGPTQPQRAAWPLIAEGGDVLVASPTGTGKTLTGFLVAIDSAYRAQATEGGAVRPTRGPGVVYVSPLRALATDVHENLQVPLAGIAEEAARRRLSAPSLSVAVRTGDTPAAERAAMRRSPPDLLVTTPESLYLLLTAPSSRAVLGDVHTVIVDEVHTLARDKRGAHLALSLERLDHLVSSQGGRLQRIGLSATQRPLDVVARLLSGVDPARSPTRVVDCGHRRDLDVAIELPASELEAVASGAQLSDVLDRIAAHVLEHRTTLVFVNTRKMAERVAHQLALRLGPGPDGASGPAPAGGDPADPIDAALQVASHHGSLSAARRRMVEQRLRAGDLRALVATASLELGIDVGPVELVCQIGSPRAIGTFLQRVGRANHQLEGTPAGRLYPMTRDELVECTALLAGVRSGHLDVLHPPVAPVDVLAQQLVAEVAAAEEWEVEPLFDLARRAAPYADLSRDTYDQVIDLVSWGIPTGRGRRGAHLHHDAVNGRLRARRGARLAALTSGGAIPETGDYRVVLDPDGVTVGSVHEDFAVEATAGDIFLLGTHSWRVVKVETGTVRVVDAGDLPPTIPFWLGEAPARTAELSEEVGALRAELEPLLARGDGEEARRAVRNRAGVSSEVADQVVVYLGAGLAALGALPTTERLVVERVFDDAEGTQLIVHAPFGGRINRALGLALRKRFCVSFDFELQAAADDDTVVLSLGPQHSFPLSHVATMLNSATVTEVLTQAVLPHPMLAARWRWNLNRALVVPRARAGRRRPIHLQRMEAEDLLAASWPALAACQENAAPGPVPLPDHVLVRQTVDRLPDRAPRCRGPGRPARGGGDRSDRRPPGRVGGALPAGPRHPDRASLHVPRRRPARGTPDPGRTGAPGPRPPRARRTPGRPAGGPVGARAVGPDCHGRGAGPGAPAAPRSRRAPRPAPVPGPVPTRSRTGSSGSRPSRPTGGPDGSRGPGRPRSVGPWPRPSTGRSPIPLFADDDALAECVGGHLAVAGPVSAEALVDGRAAPHRLGPGGAVDPGPGPDRSGPPGGRRFGHRPARRSLVRPSPARAAPRRQPWPPPPPRGAGQHRRLRPVRGLLAACGPGDPGRGALGAVVGHRAAPGAGGGGRRVGTDGPAGPGRRLRPPVARRAVPGRRGGLGPAHAAPRGDPAPTVTGPADGPGIER